MPICNILQSIISSFKLEISEMQLFEDILEVSIQNDLFKLQINREYKKRRIDYFSTNWGKLIE
jgi:hypothetical protein